MTKRNNPKNTTTTQAETVAPVSTVSADCVTRDKRMSALAGMLARLQGKNGADAGADVTAMLCKGKGGENSPFALTPKVNAQIDAWGVNADQIFTADRNPKVAKRFIQFAYAVGAKDFKRVDATTARILYALRLAGDKTLTTDALAYLVSGAVKKDQTSPESRGVSTRTLHKLFSKVGLTTAPTQISRSVGDNGFLSLAGAVTAPKGKQNREHSLNASHPMVTAFFAMFENATDEQIAQTTGDAE